MTDDMMMGEMDLETELKEKEEIIMSLRLNEHLLRDKLEISRRNMSKQLERITALEKENIELKKYKKYCAEWMGVKEENLSLRCVNMSKKRFRLAEDSNGLFSIFDNEDPEDEPLIYGARFGTETIVELLNEMNEDIQYLNAFLVHKGFAEEYIRWKGDA